MASRQRNCGCCRGTGGLKLGTDFSLQPFFQCAGKVVNGAVQRLTGSIQPGDAQVLGVGSFDLPATQYGACQCRAARPLPERFYARLKHRQGFGGFFGLRPTCLHGGGGADQIALKILPAAQCHLFVGSSSSSFLLVVPLDHAVAPIGGQFFIVGDDQHDFACLF